MDTQGPVIVDLPDEPPTRSPRRIPAGVGLALLLVIALALAVVAGARSRPVPGAGGPGAGAALPAEGDCLRWEVDPDQQTVPVAGTVQIVDCSQMHQGQVLQAWRIGAQPSSSSIEDGCRRPGGGEDVYVSLTSDWATGAVGYSTTIITSGVEAVDFLACVLIARGVFPPRALFTQASRQPAEPTADVTDRLGSARQCLDDAGRGTGCQQPHTVERVGSYSPGDSARLHGPRSSCLQHAVAAVGSSAPFTGPQALSTRVVRTGQGALVDLPRDYCDVVAPPGRLLVGTVIGLGDAPLPLG